MTHTDNLMNDFFKSQVDFINMSPNLLNAKSLKDFEYWFDKLLAVNKRSLYLFLCNKKNELNPEFLTYANKRLKMPIT